MSLPSNVPAEPDHIITDEVIWLQGAFISSLLCGVQITLSTMSFLAILQQHMRRRLRIALLVYIFLLSAIMTTGQQFSLLFIQTGFVYSREYPGGPNAFLSRRYTVPVDLASASLFVFANWMMESLMVWRCKVVCCTGDQPVWIGIIAPSLLLVCEYVTGSLFFFQMIQGREPIPYALVYLGLSILLNLTVTVTIAGRLLLHRRQVVRQFGAGHGSYYASLAAILIESASLYTAFLILVIISFTVFMPASHLLQQAVAQVQAITTMLIIYRIAHGKGWRHRPIVSSSDWRGSTREAHVENDVIHLEMVASSTQAGGHLASILSKDEETPISSHSVDQ